MAHEQENAKPEGIYISSIAELVSALETLGVPAQGTSRFFRGHGNFNYQLQPSIYRNQHLVANEDKIIRDAFTYCPESFSENETLFEKLVKLQHYGYTTRLLDLTENALVALYFAVSSSQDEIAELLVLDIPETEIKYSDSDTVAVLSAISLQQKSFSVSQMGTELFKIIENIKKSETEDCVEEKLERKNLNLSPLSVKASKKIEKIREGERKKVDKKWSRKESDFVENNYNWNKTPSMQGLLSIIYNDKPNFRPEIDAIDFQQILCVRAKLNNPRIIRQQGLFLLFGIDNNKSEQAQVKSSWIKSSEQRILIKPEHKEKILKELRTFGITKQYLFPELDSQAQEIMNRYKPEETKG